MIGIIKDTSGKALFAALVIGLAGYKWVQGEPMSDFQETSAALTTRHLRRRCATCSKRRDSGRHEHGCPPLPDQTHGAAG